MRDAVPHQATPNIFRGALTRTAQEEGFSALLVEKDYFCSLVLSEAGRANAVDSSPLVFKGGTALSKIHLGFHRLSEDLDFVIPAAVDATRGARRRLAVPWKDWIETLPAAIPGLRLRQPLTGHNESLQYIAELEYDSVLGAPAGLIKVEIGLREPLLDPQVTGQARTLLRNPFTRAPMLAEVPVPVMSLEEACAEKVRAALTRREPAIRDFFDLDSVTRANRVSLTTPRMLDLIRAKLAVPGNPEPDLDNARAAALATQLDTQLRPVLRPTDYAGFDLDRSIALVRQVLEALGGRIGKTAPQP